MFSLYLLPERLLPNIVPSLTRALNDAQTGQFIIGGYMEGHWEVYGSWRYIAYSQIIRALIIILLDYYRFFKRHRKTMATEFAETVITKFISKFLP